MTRRHDDRTGAARASAGSADSMLAKLREVAASLHAPARVRAHVPLERAELELSRVVCIEMAHELARAHALVSQRGSGARDGGAMDTAEGALQRDVAETIAVARACGVPVPRVLLRLVAGASATWPAPARMARWAQRLAR